MSFAESKILCQMVACIALLKNWDWTLKQLETFLVPTIIKKVKLSAYISNQGQMEADASDVPAEGYVAYPDEDAKDAE